MRLFAMFLWLLAPLGVWHVYATHGTPYVIVSYRFHDNGDPYDPFRERFYTQCTYIGWGWHQITQPAQGGACPWVRFFKVPG